MDCQSRGRLFDSGQNPQTKPENSNLPGFELHRPLIKGTKLLFQVIRAIIKHVCICRHSHTSTYVLRSTRRLCLLRQCRTIPVAKWNCIVTDQSCNQQGDALLHVLILLPDSDTFKGPLTVRLPNVLRNIKGTIDMGPTYRRSGVANVLSVVANADHAGTDNCRSITAAVNQFL